MQTRSLPIALLASLALFSPALQAQCAAPDGLDGGPCCVTTDAELPRPKFRQESLGICWKDCDVEQLEDYVAEWSALTPGLTAGGMAPCGWFTTRVRLSTGGVPRWRGRLQASYARTWVETNAAGELYHVWRFLVNGDLSPLAAAGPIPCPVPPCAPATGNRVRFTGYVDHARSCATGRWSQAWMLTHACDSFDHAPGFPRAGAFHPERSYTFVGPAAGFVPGPIASVEAGSGAFESLRTWELPAAGTVGPVRCRFEERVANAFVDPFNESCTCSPTGVPQFVQSDLGVQGACGSNISGLAGAIPFVSMGIGAWTDPSVFPGEEELRWNSGQYLYQDACTGQQSQEFFHGVSTFKGFPAFQYLQTGIGGPLDPTFLDQCNARRLPNGGPVRNVPYLSDKVFSLNLP